MLDEYIEWDVDEEKQKNFHDVEGLIEVLEDVQSLMDSEIYEKIYATSNLGEEIGNFAPPSTEYLLNRYRQDKYSSNILKNPTLNLFTDNIIFSHYIATSGMIGFVNYAYKKHKLSLNDLNKQHTILERLMSLLNDFDKLEDYQAPDEEFCGKLKDIKWDKQGKKLYGKIRNILYHLNEVRLGGKSSTFSNGEHFTLIFLAACSAVNQDRGKILPEDVIVAHRTFLKLLDTDINKMGVL